MEKSEFKVEISSLDTAQEVAFGRSYNRVLMLIFHVNLMAGSYIWSALQNYYNDQRNYLFDGHGIPTQPLYSHSWDISLFLYHIFSCVYFIIFFKKILLHHLASQIDLFNSSMLERKNLIRHRMNIRTLLRASQSSVILHNNMLIKNVSQDFSNQSRRLVCYLQVLQSNTSLQITLHYMLIYSSSWIKDILEWHIKYMRTNKLRGMFNTNHVLHVNSRGNPDGMKRYCFKFRQQRRCQPTENYSETIEGCERIVLRAYFIRNKTGTL